MSMFNRASYKLPVGHRSVGAFATQAEAESHARDLIRTRRTKYAFYVMDKRGAWEVIRYMPV